MALALPYPDMDFVPLDILLASELNQMVANIEFLASDDVFPVDTANIADSAVTASKIDWTTTDVAVSFMPSGTPNYLTNIQNNSYLVGGKYFILSMKANLTTPSTAFVRLGTFSLPRNIGYDAPISFMLESTDRVRYTYVENGGQLAIATTPAVSNIVVRINGIIRML